MTIPNVVLGELIDPVTFGNAVVDAVNKHETEIADRLPLTGGTLTGDLEVDGFIGAGNGSASTPSIYFKNSPDTGFFRNSPGKIRMSAGGVVVQDVSATLTTIKTDLQVDGQIVVEQNLVARGSVSFKNVLVGNSASRHLWLNSNGWVCVTDSTRGGPFAPSKLARNSDVLERAETATLPPEIETDDDGNQTNIAEVEAHDTVELFDVVTALLVKVKQLEERIEALEA